MRKLKFPKRCAAFSLFSGILILSLALISKTALSQETVVLKMVLNQEDKGVFFLVLAPDNDVWVKRSDFNALGLTKELGRDISFDGDIYVSLNSIPGLNFHIGEKEVALNISADPSLFNKQRIDSSYEIPYEVIYTKNSSAFFNYGLFYTSATEKASFDMSGELGISVGDYLGLSTFSYTNSDSTEEFTRLMTNITYNDREKLRSVIVGDFSAPSSILGSGLLLGGINLSKNYAIDPYLITYPGFNLRGVLQTPSDIEVYMDGFLIRKERLGPGEFLFTDVPATVGLGTADIVITDAFGRERILSTPYYFTDRLLTRGLHEYSYSIGFGREDFGEKSFSYSSAAFLGFHRFGLTNNITAGYAAEASEKLVNIGPTASILISRLGTVDAAMALSNSEGESGLSGFLGYSFRTRNINVRTLLRSSSREYSNLTLSPSDNKARLEFNGAAGFNAKHMGSLTAGYSIADMYTDPDTSRIFISYNKILTKNTTFFATASETKTDTTEKEIFLGLHVYFGKGVSGNINYARTEDDDRGSVRLQKSLPTGSGFGFRIEAQNYGDQDDFEGIVQYQSRYGIYEAGYSHLADDDIYGLSSAGGIGYIDRSIFFSRPINDSFAKVKVDGLKGVRVYHYGNEIGSTDGNGDVILPSLQSFHYNRIDIEGKDIPINYSIPLLTKHISPPYRSGSLVAFDVKKIQAVTGTVFITEEETKIPVDSGVMLIQTEDRPMEGLIGRDGEFYVENISPGTYPATISYRGEECNFDLVVPASDQMFIDVGEVTCE
jgi:outer membrane usher protein